MFTLSIIIPIYNAEYYLEECLDSIVNQWHESVEIICINDGSIDNSLSILSEYIQKLDISISKNFVIIDQDNQGVSNTRNVGLKKYRGKYLGFVDPDDTVLPNYFSKILEKINTKKPEIIEFKYKDSNGKILTVSDHTGNIWSTFKTGGWYLWSRVYSREILKNEVFIPNIIFEDMAFLPSIYVKAENIEYIDDSLYMYRLNPESLTRVLTKKSIDLNLFSLKTLFNFFESKSKDHDYYMYMMLNTYYLIAIYGLRFMGFRKILSCLSCININIDDSNKFNFNLNKVLFFKFPLCYLIFYKVYIVLKNKFGFLK